jgi:Skp family chaperone for outer membrane proteins
MKLTILRLGLLMLLAGMAFGCTGGKVGVVNPDLAYQKSAASEKGSAYLRNIGAELEGELRALEANVTNAKTKQQKDAAQVAMQQGVMNVQQRFNAEQQQVLNAISQVYKQALDNCRAKLGLDLILPGEAALSYAPALDVTGKVTDEMNSLPLDFTPLQPDTTDAKPAQ